MPINIYMNGFHTFNNFSICLFVVGTYLGTTFFYWKKWICLSYWRFCM